MDEYPESQWEREIKNQIPLAKQDEARKAIAQEKKEIAESHGKKKIDWEKTYPERYK